MGSQSRGTSTKEGLDSRVIQRQGELYLRGSDLDLLWLVDPVRPQLGLVIAGGVCQRSAHRWLRVCESAAQRSVKSTKVERLSGVAGTDCRVVFCGTGYGIHPGGPVLAA